MGDEPKEALYYKKLKHNVVQCQLCPRFCIINEGKRGNCGVRENQKGRLIALTYSKPCSLAFDPIEKKPLYHFLPGEEVLSIATVGCNLHCLNCQNWSISQVTADEYPTTYLPPKEVVQKAKETNCKMIAYTYTEPTVFYEYVIDIAKLAKKQGIKNIIVSNGFINPAPLKELCKYIDGANIDLKSIKPEFYESICSARLEPILDAIKILHENGVWTELTNLLIPQHNDSPVEIKKLAEFVIGIDKNMPLHFSSFYPCYKMMDVARTSEEAVRDTRVIALKAGLNYVYTGNISDEEGGTTFCPKCKKAAIIRHGFFVKENNVVNGKCKFCNQRIAGVWK